jgi:hypothetical protein
MKSYEQAKAEMRPEEIIINDLLREYKEITVEMIDRCKYIDANLIALTKEKEENARPYLEKLAELEAQIRIPMLERKATFISSSGKINFRRGATRRSYNLDALDKLAYADAYIKDKIWAFRTETTGEPSISIKLE